MAIFRYYTAKEVELITSVPYQRLDYWVRCGIVRASGRIAQGRGRPRLFTFVDLVSIRIAATLIESGLKPNVVKASIKQLQRRLPEYIDSPMTSVRVVTDGKKLYRYIKEDVVETLDEFGQLAFTFGIDVHIKDVIDKASKLEKPVRYSRENKKIENVG